MYTMASILKVEQIQEWLEEHPDFKLEGALAPLKDLMFDDNPVLMVVKLKLRGGYSGSGEKLSINECVVKEKMYLCSLNRLILCHAKKPTS